jgi:D-alanyl-lipoteichoic acid acyltransferase DltB (MBOAT superfamily)
MLYSFALTKGRVQAAKWILVAASMFFYAYGTGTFFLVFLATVIINFMIGRQLGVYSKRHSPFIRRLLLWAGLTANILPLGYYKYTDFAIYNINWLLEAKIPFQNIVLPIGISFYTFQLIAYIVDSYRGETRGYNFLNYLLFITFFPQLIVGPIVHHKDVVPQFEALKKSSPNYENISKGLFLFAIGCTKKLMLADPLSEWAQFAFDHVELLKIVEAWIASVGYTLSYYFDLSGYADMAVGLGIMFGIVIPQNFSSPYQSRNFAEYWNRWHITLSRFLGDYIFRSVYKKGKGSLNFYLAVFVTFLVSGFWHGAGWNFVVWGMVNGIFVIFAHMMTRSKKELPFILAWTLTFTGIIFTRILFVSASIPDALYLYRTLFDVESFTTSANAYLSSKALLYTFLGLIFSLFFSNSNQIYDEFQPDKKHLSYAVSLIVIAMLNMSNVMPFLYFQF